MQNEKQREAQKRNWNKLQLVNAFYTLKRMANEQVGSCPLANMQLYQAQVLIKQVLSSWESPEQQRKLQKKRGLRLPWEVDYTGNLDDYFLEDSHDG